MALHTETHSPASGPPPEQSIGQRTALVGDSGQRTALTGTIDRRNVPIDTKDLAAKLAAIVGGRGVLARPSELATYSSDGLPGYRLRPRLAVFPTTQAAAHRRRATARERADALRRARRRHRTLRRRARERRGRGRWAQSPQQDPLDRSGESPRVVEPGAVNVTLTRAAGAHGLHYAPDPSSQTACTIGGNVAENSGGPHCLKYGVTLNHVIALEVILASGEIVTLGNADGEVGRLRPARRLHRLGGLLRRRARSHGEAHARIRRACARCSRTSCRSTRARARRRRSSRRAFFPRRSR